MKINNEFNIKDQISDGARLSSASVAADIVSHPFSTIWTLQQADGKLSFRGAMQKIKKGSGFYTGFSTQLISSVPGTFAYLEGRRQALSFFSDDKYRDLSNYLFRDEKYLRECMQGLFGSAYGMTLWSPASRITMLQQASGNGSVKSEFNGLSAIGKSKYIWKTEGVRGFYRGVFSATWSFAITDALGSWIQARLLECYPENERKHFMSQLSAIWFGFSAAAIVTSPIDVCIARLKIAETNPKNFSDKEISQVVRTICKASGFRGFFRGVPAAAIHSASWHAGVLLADAYRKKVDFAA